VLAKASLFVCVWLVSSLTLNRASTQDVRPPRGTASSDPVDRIYFASGSFGLTADAKVILDAVVAMLEGDTTSGVTLRGHADRIGDRTFNQRLSRRRAESARKYLVESGIDASRIRVVAMGSRQPLDTGAGSEARARNRRVDLFISRGSP